MIIGTITTTSVATQVWQQATRTLTAFGTAVQALATTTTSLPATSSFNVVGPTGSQYVVTIAMKTGGTATAACTISLFDGTQAFVMASSAAAANSPVGFVVAGNGTIAGQGRNLDGAIAAQYMFGGPVFQP